eukprot:6950908-Pyramimonas_sp.AAC.2
MTAVYRRPYPAILMYHTECTSGVGWASATVSGGGLRGAIRGETHQTCSSEKAVGQAHPALHSLSSRWKRESSVWCVVRQLPSPSPRICNH